MKFNIAAFTHIGTSRSNNQDRILVNDQCLQEGFCRLNEHPDCFCFVADGIGGSSHGEVASQFVVLRILELKHALQNSGEKEICNFLTQINHDLLEFSGTDLKYKGTGTTLTGLIMNGNAKYRTIHAGDSELWAFKNNLNP